MISGRGNKVYVQLGSGDVHFSLCTIKDSGENPRGCIVLMQGSPGNTGTIEDGREHAVPDKFSTDDETPDMISIESSSAKSIDVVVNLLLKYRACEFPDAKEWEAGKE